MTLARRFALLLAAACALPAATLEKLSTWDLVSQSTDIVRAKVTSAQPAFRGSAGRGGIIYTHYTIEISERWKGASAAQMDVAVPGGSVLNLRQTFPGAPSLRAGGEYVFFLWTSRSGLTLIMGLTQGLLSAKVDASGAPILYRAASSEPMVDAGGNPIADAPLSMTLDNFRQLMASYGMAAR